MESFYYSLYALGALISTQTQTPSVPPPAQFPLLDPARTHRAFAQVFPGLSITELIGRILRDETYQKWQQIRNVLAHRVATAGRSVQHGDSSFSGLLSL